MTTHQQKCISANRVRGPPSANIIHLECPICRDILWKPIACRRCETPFCSVCIHQWLIHNPAKCPNRCETFTERKCPPFIAKLLAELQISCAYEEKGCQQVVPYEALDKHEISCNFAPQQCPGCKLQLLKKDFEVHSSGCESIELTCQDCKIVYKRGDAGTKHTENMCLKGQLRQMRGELKKNRVEMHELSRQLTELRSNNSVLTKVSITFADLPIASENSKLIPDIYRGLRWIGVSYGHTSYLKKRHAKSGYATSFTPDGSPHVAYFKDEASISTVEPNETFTMVSINACAAWFDHLQLTITGYRKSVQTNAHTSTLLFGKLQLILLEWNNVDKVNFQAFGGTMHPECGGTISSTQVVINQLKIN